SPRRPTRASIRAMSTTCGRSGRCWTSLLRAAAQTGIRATATTRDRDGADGADDAAVVDLGGRASRVARSRVPGRVPRRLARVRGAHLVRSLDGRRRMDRRRRGALRARADQARVPGPLPERCIGCSGPLMVALLALGVMNVAWM